MIAGGRTDLRRILTAYTINELGTWFGYIALAVAVYDETHSAIAMAGLALCGRVVPAFVVPALVARVEASTRRGSISGLYFVEAVTTVALANLLLHFWLPGVLALVAVDGTAALAADALLRAAAARAGAADPAAQTAEEGQRRANAALNIAFSVSVTIGPLLGGVLVAVSGATAVLFVDAATFAVCGAMLIELSPHFDDMEAPGIGARLRAAWRYIRDVPQLSSLLMVQAVALIFFTAAEPVEVLYAKATLAAGDSGFGAIVGAWGVGMVLGSLLFRRWVRRPLGPQLVGSIAAVGAAYIGLAAAPTVEVACAVAVVGGLGNGIQAASVISAVQKLTPSRLHARVMGAVESLGSMSPAIGFVMGGLVAAAANPRVALLVAGLGAVSLSLVVVRIVRNGVGSAPEPDDSSQNLASPTRSTAQGLASISKASS